MRVFRILILWCAIGGLPLLMAQSVPKTVAVVNGESITDEDLGRAANGRIRNLMQSPDASQSEAKLEKAKLAIRWDALNYLIERRLVRAEAARRMMSEDDLIETEIEDRIEPPSRETIEAFTEANRERMPMIKGLPPREVFSQVGAFLRVQSDRVMRSIYFEKLSKQYSVRTYLEPLRAEVATAGHASRGVEKSAVTIVVFSNFECADCANLAGTLEGIRKNNNGTVRLVYRHFPEAHLYPHAEQAAEASSCAHRQERFWEFHDRLFANSADLDIAGLRKHAAALGLDTVRFDDCVNSNAPVRDVGKDIDEAYSLGVMVAPTLFLNGRVMIGKRSLAEIQELVDEELKRSGN